ncbi:D-glycero-beta-D-manno-heptose 1-phosphate adenylyltransferase [bacterium]|nr:MAG: D-glycero-beta-D-manno-heptose 1-phosphate adenylyltransferase [bacterium]
MAKQKILTDWAALKKTIDSQRAGRKVVFTNGCFDILHVGHVRYLQEARAQGDLLLVALNTDASVKRLKGPERPIQNEGARSEIMAALGCVDFVTLFDQPTPEDLIREIRPDVLVKGGDWTVDKIAGGAFVQSYGGEVKSLHFSEGHSTTNIVEKIRN